jgi:hypothetical protein
LASTLKNFFLLADRARCEACQLEIVFDSREPDEEGESISNPDLNDAGEDTGSVGHRYYGLLQQEASRLNKEKRR